MNMIETQNLTKIYGDFYGGISSESSYSQRKCLWIFRSKRGRKVYHDENVSRSYT